MIFGFRARISASLLSHIGSADNPPGPRAMWSIFRGGPDLPNSACTDTVLVCPRHTTVNRRAAIVVLRQFIALCSGATEPSPGLFALRERCPLPFEQIQGR